jgi:hypothetical protein
MTRRGIAAAIVAASACGVFAAGKTPGTIEGVLTGLVLHTGGTGTMVCCGRSITVPVELRLTFPGGSLTLSELFALAPAACRAHGESGLLANDRCVDDRHSRRSTRVVADILISGEGAAIADRIVVPAADDRISGAVTFIHPRDGYLRIGGEYGVDAHGRVLRINDPHARITVQQGAMCGDEGNCSPDVRFAFDANTPSVRSAAGRFVCVPTVAHDGCAPTPPDGGAALQPLRLADHVVAIGAEHVLRGDRVFVAHTLIVDERN